MREREIVLFEEEEKAYFHSHQGLYLRKYSRGVLRPPVARLVDIIS